LRGATLASVIAAVGLLFTGLGDQETRELLTTRDVATAVRLVHTGLTNSKKLPLLPA
jgi:hypothetical protein